MPDHPSLALRIEPRTLPALRAAYEEAALGVKAVVNEVRRRGRLPGPWAADEISVAMAEHYNHEIMDGAYSTLVALERYEQELTSVVDTLKRMEVEYRRTESENSERWRQL
ncbi:hypothetical protein [Pseudonocardia nigra]|uniref:hypothetical protein n=1 Tax=Pseudonocardia nigra TaxID=1921578 RepID=UPI001C5EB150|nr:hypothetical protein [Pseudonocardia nigra]